MIILPVRGRWWIFRYWRRQPFNFTVAAWFQYYDDMDWDFEQIGKTNIVEASAKMAYYAAMQGNYAKGKPFKYSFKEFVEQLADMRASDADKLKVLFADSSAKVSERMASKKK